MYIGSPYKGNPCCLLFSPQVALLLLVPLTVEGDEALSEEEDEEEPGIVEIVFSFDTTGSMYPVIGKVSQVDNTH